MKDQGGGGEQRRSEVRRKSEEAKLKLYLYNPLCRKFNETCTIATITIK